MKIAIASMHHHSKIQSFATRIRIPVMAASTRDIMALTWGVLVAVAIITLYVWAAGNEVSTYLGVSTWGLGFIFLALAVDNQGRQALYQVITGLALLSLALLQNSVAPEFIIVSGIILAAWIAGVVFSFLRTQTL